MAGFRSVLCAKYVERWIAKDVRYARNTESGYNLNHLTFDSILSESNETDCDGFVPERCVYRRYKPDKIS